MNFKMPAFAFALFILFSACPLKESIVWLNDPLEADEHIKLGAIYEKEGRLDLAEEQYLLALKKDRSRALAWAGLGNVQMASDRPGRAARSFKRAIELEPDSPDILNNLAAAYLAEGRLDAAEEAVNEAISRGGDNLHYYLDTRGQIRLKKNDYSGALSDFCRALEVAPAADDDFLAEVNDRIEIAGGACR